MIYQIFPDRFRNGRTDNDPKTGDVALRRPGRSSSAGASSPRATAATTPTDATTVPPASAAPSPRAAAGRDYEGGDLKGVDQKLDYLKALGVNTIYFNPIFEAESNHRYDTPTT